MHRTAGTLARSIMLATTLTSSLALAQPQWQVNVDDINAAGGIFDVGNPAEPGVLVETFGFIEQFGPNVSIPYYTNDPDLDLNVLIPAGPFDWGATAEGFGDIAAGAISSAAGAFVIDGEDSSNLHVHWTAGASIDIPSQRRTGGNAITRVSANARIQLTNLVPGALYQLNWTWEADGAAASATGFFNSFSSYSVGILMDGVALTAVGNPIASNSILVPDLIPLDFHDEGDGALSFVATPGFTCNREFLISVASTATVTANGSLTQVGLSSASNFGDLVLTIEKMTQSPIEQQGDINCDGDINGLDIQPILLLRFDADLYAQIHPCCPISNADIDLDQEITINDISLFVDFLLTQ